MLRRHEFVALRRGGLGGRVERWECSECFLGGGLAEAIQGYRYPAVLSAPAPGFNGYRFHSGSRATKDGFLGADVQTIMSYLPKEGEVCADCGRAAQFGWVSSELFGSDPYSGRLSPDRARPEVVCGACAVTRLRRDFHDSGTGISEFFLAEDAPGFWVSTSL